MGWKYFNDEEEEKLLKEALGEKPAYTNSYADSITALEKEMESRPDFSYDPDSDPLYRQYETQYRREGSRAMEDTLASAASHAGGMNSYAVTAAQQAGDYYNAQLMDRIPELAELAYEMYRTDYDRDLDRLEQLRRQEAEDYGRYRDAVDDWYAELKAAYQQYRDGVADSKWREQLDHQKQQDAVDDQYRQDALEHEKEQDALDYQKWLVELGFGGVSDPEEPVQPEAAQSQTAQPQTAGDPYAGTDYYQQAIDAALKGDRAGAEAALDKRAAKMADPAYTGTGGGTSMEEARQYIHRLLAAAADPVGMLSGDAWQEQRDGYLRSGSGPVEVTAYDTYEDYVRDYLRYLAEGSV